jgi:hypothetical protein
MQNNVPARQEPTEYLCVKRSKHGPNLASALLLSSTSKKV